MSDDKAEHDSENPAIRSGVTDTDTNLPDGASLASSSDPPVDWEPKKAHLGQICVSVLQAAPGVPGQGPPNYTNLTPWVAKVFFMHTYYAYVYVFYMFVLAFYKGYALEYPDWRRWFEMVLIMIIPGLQHLRFYFGYWGCEHGMCVDLASFLFLCSAIMFLLMYFLFKQAYILPLDTTFLFIAVVIVGVEGVCGAINMLQTLKIQSTSLWQLVMMSVSIVLLLATVILFCVWELLPREAMVEELHFMDNVQVPSV
mmetsp:Transcript_110395/g.235765  ORF Transcript_110395/g.235765 Transcript_110395/m.235765 type:complete len:255 (+) Transcript_110395:88-852(+)